MKSIVISKNGVIKAPLIKPYVPPLVVMIVSSIILLVIVLNLIIQAIPHVSLDDYQLAEDAGILSEKQIDIFNEILEASASEDTCTIVCGPLTNKEKHGIITQLGLYYGSMEGVSKLVSFNDDTVTLNTDLFSEFEERKVLIDARVDEAIANLYEGPDEYKLWQICNYIANRIQYTSECRETLQGLNGNGVCITYSMLFYKMASRLGYQVYICFGYANNSPDSYHAWNMVELHGKQYYYDITWYDKPLYDIRYIHSSESWGRIGIINNQWYDVEKE